MTRTKSEKYWDLWGYKNKQRRDNKMKEEQAAREMTVKEMLDCGTYSKDDVIRILEVRLNTARAPNVFTAGDLK
jgi:hypothetical protein